MESQIPIDELALRPILNHFGFSSPLLDQTVCLHERPTGDQPYLKLILSVTLADGCRLVLKLLREDPDLPAFREKTERQSAFSEFLRANGIRTPWSARTFPASPPWRTGAARRSPKSPPPSPDRSAN